MLFKNTDRSLMKKWMQLTGLGIIILLSAFIYSMMSYGATGVEQPTLTYLSNCNQEDFSVEILDSATEGELEEYPGLDNLSSDGLFTLSDIKKQAPTIFMKIMEARIGAFEVAYSDCSFELRQFKKIWYDFNGVNHEALIIKDSERINLSYIEEGAKPVNGGEIALTREYAQKNNIAIGDYFELEGKAYMVTGFVLFPDYTLTMFDDTMSMNTALQALILMTDSEYESMDEQESFRLSGVNLNGNEISTAFDNEELPFVNEIIATENSLRSGAVYDAFSQNRAIAIGLSIFISIIALIMVSVLIDNLLNAERGQIGILKALGYSRVEIAAPYLTAITLFSLIVLSAGYILGYLSSDYLNELMLNFYLIPSVEIHQNFFIFETAVFLPAATFFAVSIVVVRSMLRRRALDLLKPRRNDRVNLPSRLAGKILKNAKGSTKLKYIYIFRNTGSFIIVTIGVMFSTILIYFAFMATGMTDRMTIDYLKKVDYQYESYVDTSKGYTSLNKGEEKFLVCQYAYLDGYAVNIRGLSTGNRLYKLYNDSGEDITRKIYDGAVITKRLSIKLGIEPGDTIRVRIKNDFYDLTVKGIADEYVSDTIFMNIETLSGYITEGESIYLYNGIYSLSKPSEEYYSSINSKDDIMAQSEAMQKHSRFIIRILTGCSSIIAASILFILSSFTVESNFYDISLLKVFGYNRREVNSMILNSYFVYTVVSYLISIPVALSVIKKIMMLFVQKYDVVLPLKMEPVYGFISVLVMLLVFLAGTYASRKKISKISLQEIIKTYGD